MTVSPDSGRDRDGTRDRQRGPSGLTAVQYGVGPIGHRIVETAAARGVEFVGAIDIDPEKVGRDLGQLADAEAATGVTVTDDPAEALASEPDVVFHSTVSGLEAVKPQLERCLAAGADVVSTTEELAYPWHRNAAAARDLDEAARASGRSVLGAGINPGFAMDCLPAVLTTPCRSVEAVRVTRVQDAAVRRRPLQEKIGAGTTLEAFESEIAERAGHVGLPESVAMLAAAVGWDLDDVRETIEPVVATNRVASEHVAVDPGEVAGIHQVGRGVVDGRAVVELDLTMAIGADDPRDEVHIVGDPDLDVRVAGGFHGDVATPGIVVNAVPRVRDAAPGLVTMLDLALPRFER